MTGLNQTGFGASSPLGCSARAGFDDFVRAMREILVEPVHPTERRPDRGRAGRIESQVCPSREPADAARARGSAGRASAARVGVVGVLGELLLTAGALILLFLGWQLWWNDAIMAGQQSDAASDLSARVARGGERAERGDDPPPAESADYGDPVVDTTPYANGDAFAVMYVPRFGEDSQRQVAEGIGLDVLNSFDLGRRPLPRYPDARARSATSRSRRTAAPTAAACTRSSNCSSGMRSTSRPGTGGTRTGSATSST